MTEDQVLALLRREIKKAGNQRQWALKNGISTGFLGDVLHGRAPIGPSILKVLGLEVESTTTTYRWTHRKRNEIDGKGR